MTDLYRGLDLGAKGDGFLLLVMAVVIVSGGSTARRSPPLPWRRRADIAADLGVAVVSAWIIFRVQSNFVVQPVLVMTATVTLSAVSLACVLLWGDVRDHPQQPSAGQALPEASPDEVQARSTVRAGKLGAGGTLLAGGVALLPFWFTAHYMPSHDSPVVQVASGIENVDRRDGYAELTVEITIENKGNTPVTVLTSLYEITGTEIEHSQKPKPLDGLPYGHITDRIYGSAARVSPYNQFDDPKQIQVGPAAEDYALIGPDEEVKTTLIVRAPLFPLYRITVDARVARADRVEVEDWQESPRRIKKCDSLDIAEDRRPLLHRGVFDRLTESDREVVTFWVIDGPQDFGEISPWWAPFPWSGASIQHAGHACDHAFKPNDQDGLEETAMVGWSSAVGEAGLPAAPSS